MESEDEDDPEATTSLARLAASAFVVHGTHFTVLKQIHPDDVYDLHVAAIDWLFRKVSALVKQQASQDTKDAKARAAKQRSRVLTYLRPLALLLGPVTGRDALRIRAHLEQAVDDAGAAAQTRASQPYRAYEKRLVAIAGKDSGLKVTQKKTAPKTIAVVEEDVEAEEPEREAADLDEPIDEPMDATPNTPTPSKKRGLPRDSVLPELEFDPADITMNMDEEIDLAFGDTPDRNRSVSVEPLAKRKKSANSKEY